MEFGCSKCSYISFKKENVTRHINRKNKCGTELEIIEIPIEIKCKYCNKIFSSSTSLFKHQNKNCKAKVQILEEENKELIRKMRNRENINNENTNDKEDENYIYLIKIYPYQDNIYKIGRTGDIKARLASYKRYKILFITSCENDVLCEKELIDLYRSETEIEQCKEMGNEYFCGEYQTIKNIVQNYFGNS